MPSARCNKAKARRSREADMMSDIENMDVILGSGEYNQIAVQNTISNMLNRDDKEE